MLKKKFLAASLLLIFIIGITSCDKENSQLVSNSNTDALQKIAGGTEIYSGIPTKSDSLSQDVMEDLKYMREEEKLARDVYITLNDVYHYRVFKNIAKSEQRHMNAIKFLLKRYDIEDPVKDNGVGVFTNQDLQELFNNLVVQGNTSGVEALKVGAAIEEIDILDLFERIKRAENYRDIVTVYKRLEKGSENHLKAFVHVLKTKGVDYSPQYLDQATFDKIINSSHVVPVPRDSTLSDEEKAALQFMREEEKLARDAYKTFYDKYKLRIFRNISRSEQAHTNAVKRLLKVYKVEDPVKNNEVGVFTNEELQNLYNTLVQQGSVSEVEALKVGGAIEEIDILDLEKRIELTKDHLLIKRVFTRLEKGSESHLRAFVRNLSFRGVTYEPQYLDQERFNQIINP